jgi:hypothetical protein
MPVELFMAYPMPQHPLGVGHVTAERACVPISHVAKHAQNLSGNVPPTLTLPLKGGGNHSEPSCAIIRDELCRPDAQAH